MRYVKVDDLQEYCDHQIAHEITPNEFQRMNHLEIVRCKDCHYYESDRICAECLRHNGFSPEPDFFCADGKVRCK